MESIDKNLALLLILIIAISSLSLMMVKPTFAQSSQTPHVPEFTVDFVNASYTVTSTNSYTGVNETRLVSNNTIRVTIMNQAFGSYSSKICYNIRVRPHFGVNNWTEIYPLRNFTSSYNADGTFSYAQYINPDSPTHSNSSHTIVAFPLVATEYYGESGYDIQRYYSGDIGQEGRYFAFLHGIPANAQIDFQVEALVGQNSTYWYVQHPLFPQYGGFYEPAIAYVLDSDWSDAQKVTLGSTSPSPTPTVPEFQWLAILPLCLSILSVAGLLFIKKRQALNA